MYQMYLLNLQLFKFQYYAEDSIQTYMESAKEA